jgi:hypothetical protein
MKRFLILLISSTCAYAAQRAIPVDVAAPRYHQTILQGITLHCVSFDARSHRLQLLDQPNGPGTIWADARAAAASVQGLAAINAGFFTPQGKPLGVMIADGKKLGSNNPSSLGAAVWFEANGRTGIIRREKTNFNAPFLLQSGPVLAENSKAIAGLENNKTSARCFIAWDGGTLWMIARTSPCTLTQLSQAIAGQSPCGFPINIALNLDGGTSADLFVSKEIAGSPIIQRAFWNKPVRNFLVLQKRN